MRAAARSLRPLDPAIRSPPSHFRRSALRHILPVDSNINRSLRKGAAMAAVLEKTHPDTPQHGASFLFQPVGATRIHTPESFTEEQRLYYRTALQFCREQVLPKAEQIEHKDNALLRELLRKAGEIGLLMIDIPERFGGLALDKTTSNLVTEAQSLLGSWSVTFGAHVGIGSLPIVWFGNEQQKAKYLPKLATGEWVAAYALTETGSGSDALGAKTKAVLSPD